MAVRRRHDNYALRLLLACVAVVFGGARGEAVDAPPIPDAHAIIAVLREAEDLGLPSLAGARIVQGELTRADAAAGSVAAQGGRIHAQLADGSWLVDLSDPLPAAEADATEVAALRPMDPASLHDVHARVLRFRYTTWVDDVVVLTLARRCEIGIPVAPERLARTLANGGIHYGSQEPAALAPASGDALERVRLACRWWFLARVLAEPAQPRWAAAALAISPPGWRERTRRLLDCHQAALVAPSEPDGSPAGAVRRYRFDGGAAAEEADLQHAISSDDLVALLGDQRPAGGFATIGERAAVILRQRWYIDPAWFSGRDRCPPWDDPASQAVAAGVQDWWRATAGRTWPERIAVAAATASWPALVQLAMLTATDNDGRDPAQTISLQLGAAIAQRFATPPPTEVHSTDISAILERFPDDAAITAAVGRWPKDGPLAAAIAAFDDAHGAHDGVDALVASWAAQPDARVAAIEDLTLPVWRSYTDPDYIEQEAADTALRSPVAWWVAHPTAERWSRLREWLSGDPADLRTQRLIASCGRTWLSGLTNQHRTPPTLEQPLAWVALHDGRALTPALTAIAVSTAQENRIAAEVWGKDDVEDPRAGAGTPGPPAPGAPAAPGGPAAIAAPAGDLRVCDLAALQLQGSLAALRGAIAHTITGTATTRTLRLSAALAERDAVIAELLAALAVPVREALEAAHLPLPQELARPGGAAAAAVAAAAAPGLSAEEAAACRAVLQEAKRLGFPDLSGASVRDGRLQVDGGGSWYGCHVQLADGSWLADTCIPLAAEAASCDAPVRTPADRADVRSLIPATRLPVAARERLAQLRRLGSLATYLHELGLSGIAWWLSGLDPEGQNLLAMILRNADTGQDRGSILHAGPRDSGWADAGGEVELPSVDTGLRRIVCAWFRARLANAGSAAEAERWARAASAIMASGDRGLLEPLVERLRGRRDCPDRAAPGAPLVERLRAWRGDGRDPATGGWHEGPVAPATRGETAELIALVGDDRASCWLDADWTPRTVGDNALRALAQLWGVDWRWLVSDDPALHDLIPTRPAQENGQGEPYGDAWLWARGVWSDAQRHAVALALGQWWQAHRGDGASAPIAWSFRTLPLTMWEWTLAELAAEDRDPAIAERIASRIAALPPITDNRIYHGEIYEAVAMAGWRFPAHAGITTSLASWTVPWTRNLLALRAGLAGDERQLDAWMERALATGRGPSARFRGDAEAATTPLFNLGLWAYRPTAHRLAALRALLGQELSSAGTRWLIAHAGDDVFPVLGDVRCRDELRHRTGSRAIPAALALDALADARPLPLDRAIELRNWSLGSGGSGPDLSHCAGARVCDWAAAQLLITDDRGFTGWIPESLHNGERFLSRSPVERDHDIAELRSILEPVVQRLLGEASLIATAPQPSDF